MLASSAPAPDVTSLATESNTLEKLSPQGWRKLASSLRGTLVLPTSPGYATRCLLYNSRFAGLKPAAIAYCHGPDDVARCLDFVTKHDLPVAARSGGHSYGGYSSSPGLVVDVSRLAGIDVNAKAKTAKIGTGARLIDVYNTLDHHGLALPGGTCPTVGIAGSTMGGGVGVFARKFGLTCDHLIGSRLVTAGGDHIVANDEHHSDLLWALKGGGGGNFALATSFEFELSTLPTTTLFSLQYPWSEAAVVLEGWQHWIDVQPDELWSNCQLFSQGSAGFLVQINGVFCGTERALNAHLTDLSSMAGRASSTFVGADAYLEAMKIEAGCSRLSVVACHLAGDSPGGLLGHEAYAAKSSYVNTPDTRNRTSEWVHAVESLAAAAPYVGGGLAFDSYGGAINRVAKDATAFVHRDKLAGVQATYSWGTHSASSEIAAGERWLRWLGSEVFNERAGAYQNYIDPTLANWPDAYYGTNLTRLIRVKNAYDPENRFSFAQSIPLRL
ncbi:MAG: FAD-binding oxidoreductase [Acidimicrobiales bacterium]